MDGLDNGLIFGVDAYIRGMLAWWIMDVEIIRQTNGKHTVADIIKILWQNKKKNNQNIITYTEQDIIDIINKMCKKNLKLAWQKLFWDTKNLDIYIKNAAKLCGLKFTRQIMFFISKKQNFTGYTLITNNKASKSEMENFESWTGLCFPKS